MTCFNPFNQLLHDGLLELRDRLDAKQRSQVPTGLGQQHNHHVKTLQKAAKSIAKCPLFITCGSDAKDLEGVGAWTVRHIDEIFFQANKKAREQALHGRNAPSHSNRSRDPNQRPRKRHRPSPSSTQSTHPTSTQNLAHRGSPLVILDDSSNEGAPPPVSAASAARSTFSSTQPVTFSSSSTILDASAPFPSTQPSTKPKKPYKPRVNSMAAAIFLALHQFGPALPLRQILDRGSKFLTRGQLMLGQGSTAVPSGPAKKALGQLIENRLVQMDELTKNALDELDVVYEFVDGQRNVAVELLGKWKEKMAVAAVAASATGEQKAADPAPAVAPSTGFHRSTSDLGPGYASSNLPSTLPSSILPNPSRSRSAFIPVADIRTPSPPPNTRRRAQRVRSPPPVHSAEAVAAVLAKSQPAPNSSQRRARRRGLERDYATFDTIATLRWPHDRLENYELVLLLDHREERKVDSVRLRRQLADQGMLAETRALTLGDVAWVLRLKGTKGTENELMLDILMERKEIQDLISSIVSDRYREQKDRYSKCGIRRIVYVIEGNVQRRAHYEMGQKQVPSAVATMAATDGFLIKTTKNENETALYLRCMTRRLSEELQRKFRRARVSSGSSAAWFSGPTLEEFDRVMKKQHEEISSSVLFGLGLTGLNKCGPKVIEGVLEKFPTPRCLVEGLELCQGNAKEEEKLIANIPTIDNVAQMVAAGVNGKQRRRRVGPATGKVIRDVFRLRSYVG